MSNIEDISPENPISTDAVGAALFSLVRLAMANGDESVAQRAEVFVQHPSTLDSVPRETRFVLDVFNLTTAEINARWFSGPAPAIDQ